MSTSTSSPNAPRHLLIIAHGSRRAASNQEVRDLAERVRSLNSPGFDAVEAAFLELAEPGIPEGLAQCMAKGAREIVVFPYFLAAGTHVAQDIPEAVNAFSQAHPDVKIRLATHLGAASSLPGTIVEMSRTSNPN